MPLWPRLMSLPAILLVAAAHPVVADVALSPAERTAVRELLTSDYAAAVDALAAELAIAPLGDFWRPSWTGLCSALALDRANLTLVARYTLLRARELAAEKVAAATGDVERAQRLQDRLRREIGRVVEAADRVASGEQGGRYRRPEFIPDRSLASLAPSAGGGIMVTLDELQQYLGELREASDIVIERQTTADHTLERSNRDAATLEERLPKLEEALLECGTSEEHG